MGLNENEIMAYGLHIPLEDWPKVTRDDKASFIIKRNDGMALIMSKDPKKYCATLIFKSRTIRDRTIEELKEIGISAIAEPMIGICDKRLVPKSWYDINVSIRPRTEKDRGGYACMPMKFSIPNGRKGWKLVKCPECGRECWRIPEIVKLEKQGAKPVCTMCAIKKGMEEQKHE